MNKRELQQLCDFIRQAGLIMDMRSPHAMPIILRAYKAMGR